MSNGIRLSEFAERPELQRFMQGITLELRLSDGTKRRTHLVNYCVGTTRQEDGSLLAEDDPFVHFLLPAELTPQDVSEGTEIWWLDEEPGMSQSEVKQMLADFQQPDFQQTKQSGP